MAETIAPSKIKYTTLYPTSLIVNGLDRFGYELAKSLTEQGGYVIIVDNLERELNFPEFSSLKNTAFIDFVGVADMVEEIRRLDYVFYLNHSTFSSDAEFSSQEFLAASSYLNQILNLAVEFEALFLLTNSIRAHKQLLSLDRFAGKLLEGNDTESRPYTEAEFVRYSENLVLEYKNNKGLQAKILRMGELLGEGIELDKDTQVGALVWAGINGQDLYLDRDGLETEYYVHILDAVYGVLKAEFTKDTKEAIFTLAYPEPLTQLSLAYKVQEFELEAGEIKFVDEDEAKIRLDLPVYKAATNLSKIGWQPKVDLSTALVQSMAYAKKLKQVLVEGAHKEQTIKTQANTESETKIAAGGALARLIAERKQQESTNKNKFQAGVAELELKKRNTPWHTKVRRRSIRWYDGFKQNFAFLQQITLLEAAVYTILLTIFAFIFLTLLSPLMLLVRDFTLLESDVQAGVKAANSGNWQEFNAKSASSKQRVDSLTETINNADILFFVLGRNELRQELLALTQSLGFYVDSLANFAESVEQTEQFYDRSAGELVFRPTNASVLSISQTEAQTEAVDITKARSQNEIARRSLENATKIYSQLDRNKLPAFLLSFSDNVYANQQQFDEAMLRNENALTVASNMSQEDYVVGVVVQDNIRSTFNGGLVTTLGVLQFSKGRLVNIKLLPVQNVDFKVTNLTADELAAINQLARGDLATSEQTSARELLKYSLSFDSHQAVLRKALSQSFNTEVDTVVSFNSLAFEELFNHYGEIQINGEPVNKTNFLQQINTLQAESTSSRDIVITNITALLFAKYFNTQEPLARKLELMGQLQTSNKILVETDILASLNQSEPDPDIFVAALTNSTKRFEINPAIDLNIVSELSSQQALVEVKLNTNNAPDVDRVVYCTRKSAKGFDLNDTPLENYARVELEDRSCLIFATEARTGYEFSYRQDVTDVKEYKGSIANAPGLGVRYDVEIVYPANYLLKDTAPVANRRANSVFYSGETYRGFNFVLNFN